MKIKTSEYPHKSYWTAYDDETHSGPDSVYGIGPTKEEAIKDLFERMAELEEESE